MATFLEADEKARENSSLFVFYYPRAVADPIRARLFEADGSETEKIEKRLQRFMWLNPEGLIILMPSSPGGNLKLGQEKLIKSLAAYSLAGRVFDAMPSKLSRFNGGVAVRLNDWDALRSIMKIIARDNQNYEGDQYGYERIISRVVVP